MVFYAKSQNEAGETETVSQHLQRVGALCGSFLAPIGYETYGTSLGFLHDFGKLSLLFQDVLLRKRSGVNHAVAGAAFLNYITKDRPLPAVFAMQSVIAGHHSQLRDISLHRSTIRQVLEGSGSRLDSRNLEFSLFGISEIREAAAVWQADFSLQKLSGLPAFSQGDNAALSEMLFTRLLYSALIDADWTASAEYYDAAYLTEHSGHALDAESAYARLLAVREEKRRCSTADPHINELRDRLFEDCAQAGSASSGVFTLTAPTGLGKTLSLMAFALRHAITHKKRRIILLLPYLSIIEQNARDYRKIFPDLLEIHSHAPQDEKTAALSERWDAPCIVTTNVSFFEPLFSDSAGDCRHLHQLTNSVIVLDEAQTLPGDLLNASLQTLKELCMHYGCSVVLSTATQPSYQYRRGLHWQPTEIVSDPAALFDATRRVQWNWRVSEPIPLEALADEAAAHERCAIIVNLKRHARSILQRLQETCPQDRLYYLTTDLCPAHRSRVLQEVRKKLQMGKPCILVATQCIEAGVDLDFPVIYRALAPLDALIQAAGRCNRNGTDIGTMHVFLPDAEGNLYPTEAYGMAAMCVKELLAKHPIDGNNPSHIAEYYARLYAARGQDANKLTAAILEKDYEETAKNYKMISESGVQIIVPYAGELAQYHQVCEEYRSSGLTAKLLAMAKGITVASYDREQAETNCERLCFRSYGKEAVPTSRYLLGIESYYDGKLGLNFDAPFDGIY